MRWESACEPKFSELLTSPFPKNLSQARFTQTRAVNGFVSLTNHLAKPRTIVAGALGKGGKATAGHAQLYPQADHIALVQHKRVAHIALFHHHRRGNRRIQIAKAFCVAAIFTLLGLQRSFYLCGVVLLKLSPLCIATLTTGVVLKLPAEPRNRNFVKAMESPVLSVV